MASVGETLRQERLRQGLSLDEVAGRTRINARFLEALEEEEFDQLPGRFFARSFLRQYAAFLGVGEEGIAEALARLEPPAEPLPPAPWPPAPSIGVAPLDLRPAARREALKRWLGSVAALVLAIVICAAVYALWQRFHAPPPAAAPGAPQPAPPLQAALPPAQPSAPPAETIPAGAPASTTSAPAPEPAAPINLEIRTTQETWIRVLSDGKVAFVGTLPPGQSRSFAACENMNLLTGNAGGMEAVFNGRPLGPLGPPGQIRVLELTPSAHRLLERKPPPEPWPAPAAATRGGAAA